MIDRLQYNGDSLIFQTMLDKETTDLISKHFTTTWSELDQAVRLTALSFDNKYSQYLFPIEATVEQPLIMKIPHLGNHFYYADLGILRNVQTFVTVCRSSIFQILEDGRVDAFDWFSFQRDHSATPLLEQNKWWEYFTGYSLSKN